MILFGCRKGETTPCKRERSHSERGQSYKVQSVAYFWFESLEEHFYKHDFYLFIFYSGQKVISNSLVSKEVCLCFLSGHLCMATWQWTKKIIFLMLRENTLRIQKIMRNFIFLKWTGETDMLDQDFYRT